MKTDFQSDTIGIEQEICNLRWLNTGEDRLIANLYSLDDDETPLVSITSDMADNAVATIELVTSPVEQENSFGIELRKRAVEAATRIMYECAEQGTSFPFCEIKRGSLSLTQEENGGDSRSQEWAVQFTSKVFPVSLRLRVYHTPAVIFKNRDYQPSSIRFSSQVSVGIPVEQLGNFLDQFRPQWWKCMTGDEKYYTLPEERLGDSQEPTGGSGIWPSDQDKRSLAETAYNYFMCMLESAQNTNRYKLCLSGEFLDAEQKNAWGILPRCAPWKTTCNLLELAGVDPEEFRRFTDSAYMEDGIAGDAYEEIRNRLLQSPGLTHTTLSGVTIDNKPAVVMELRGQGDVRCYEKYLCPNLSFEEISA